MCRKVWGLALPNNYVNVENIMSKVQTQFLPESVRNRKDFDIRAGDTVRVNVKIQEKGKTRIQAFEGLVLARKHGSENGGTITVRKVASGVGVERIFPIYSPNIESIEITRRAKVRQSKLYFLRNAVAKTMRYKLRRISDMFSSTSDLPAWENPEADEVAETPTEETEATAETEAEAPVETADTAEQADASENDVQEETNEVEAAATETEESAETPAEEDTSDTDKKEA